MQASPAPTWQIAARRAGLRAADNAFHAPKQSISELTAAEPLKDEFLAILGHELRSPLVAVQNAVRILNREAGQDLILQRRMHSLIERQVRQMLLLTAGLRDVSRMSRGQLRLQRERVDLRVVQILMGHASIRSTEVYTHLTEPIRQQVRSKLDSLADGLT